MTHIYFIGVLNSFYQLAYGIVDLHFGDFNAIYLYLFPRWIRKEFNLFGMLING